MSSSSNAPPSIDPADLDSLTGTIRFAFNKMFQDVNGMLPAQVVAFNRTTNRVQVQPLIAVLTTNNTLVTRPQIASIPVFQIGGGGAVLNFNLNPGDLGWILASDRDISVFLQGYAASPPGTQRMADFADSLFIPNVMTGFTINPEDTNNAVLQSIDGTKRISIWPDKIKTTVTDGTNTATWEITSTQVTITALNGLVVNGPMTVTGLLDTTGGLTASGSGSTPINITGNVGITGTLAVTGDITATGDITPHV